MAITINHAEPSGSTAAFALVLSSEPAPAYLPEGAVLSVNGASGSIHLPDGALVTQLQVVQRAGRQLYGMGIKQAALEGERWDLEMIWAFHQGYFNPKKRGEYCYPPLNTADEKTLNARINSCDWVREIINSPAGELTPLALCEQAIELLQPLADEAISAQIIHGNALLEAGWQGIYAVGKGSKVPPAMLVLDYNPTQDETAPVAIALVGKGITFDSGGYSLKPSDGMSVMKSDMGGAATLTGALAQAILNGLDKRVVLILSCAENMVSGSALKLGDIIRYKNGLSVEVLNSDAEGRLVLADGLLAAMERDPEMILDAATLTGSAKMALGRDYHAVLGYNQMLVQQLLDHAKQQNEWAWPLPLAPWHSDSLTSAFADVANIHVGEGIPGASTAAAFLAKFVGEKTDCWLHMDLSASYQKNSNALWAAGGKGHGVCTIASFILAL